MQYTADRLKLLRVPQLKKILDEMSLTTTGLELDLIERIVADQVDHQDVTLYMSGPPATSASVGAATAVVVPTPTISQDTIADLVQHLELRPQAARLWKMPGSHRALIQANDQRGGRIPRPTLRRRAENSAVAEVGETPNPGHAPPTRSVRHPPAVQPSCTLGFSR
ncbi:hypothetical protein BV898_18191 [Hypsibius exemplaris]|uniref:SAP domain-containing protein n=1 Tax=Hypsibius exemplaris TaxID=2072580 RepID=A0A9X6NH56_HYPEX|nr:hypothetical protein BV898_18191 [Hypsibius exemplaris]